ncbi:polyprenyl synthetase family protein [Bradyrhizobium erythrophlei]|uniref:Geranylgeranyl pyrophosphate synthase n=1 Tax=Bradyrhizobium erythrophlei TaxID=1437360 RepID=A0A1M5IGY0_9BRAD|nr:polyprenyl synthetase family protein [Bradyrhizobium erythrophlei]SHG27496.1 Geranylgeranyl pyrophosphate synthase [Bradyrhizobium erythrophlei]
MVAIERKPEPPPETFLSRANGKTFEAVRRLLDRTGQRPCISSSLLSDTEARALGIPASVISSVQDLSRPLFDVLNRGGKGWRGYALAICCEIVGGDFDRLEDWLAFSEILHAGSLIVDDVEDGAKLRRGGPACYLVYGTPSAINSGTLAYFQVQFLIENSGLSEGRKAAIYKEYVDLLRIAHIGQGLDLGLSIASPMLLDLSDSGIAVVEEHVCVSHRLKTGVPFRAFARIGATLGNGSAEEITALGDFFLALGTAYQAIDDVINVAGLHNNTKERGEDLRTGRITLPVVHFLRAAAQPQREILLAEFQAATTDAPTHGRLLDSLAGSGVLDLCRTQARLAVRSELRALARTFPHADLQPLHEFATLVIEDYY